MYLDKFWEADTINKLHLNTEIMHSDYLKEVIWPFSTNSDRQK